MPSETYAERLATFTSWPHVTPSASTVARAGFHWEFDPAFPDPDLTVCSLCGLDPCEWQSDGDPFDFHAARSPECPFVRTTQQKKLRNKKTRQQYKRRTLQQTKTKQCSTENIAEKATSCSISTVNKSQVSTAPHQAVKQSDGVPASSHSDSKIYSCNSFRLRFLAKPYHYTELVSPLGYIRYAEEMEATGQG